MTRPPFSTVRRASSPFRWKIRNIARLSFTVLAQTGRHQLTAKMDKRPQRSRQCGEEATASPPFRRSEETPVLNNGREVVGWIGLQFLQGLRLLTGCTGLAGTLLNQVSVKYLFMYAPRMKLPWVGTQPQQQQQKVINLNSIFTLFQYLLLFYTHTLLCPRPPTPKTFP